MCCESRNILGISSHVEVAAVIKVIFLSDHNAVILIRINGLWIKIALLDGRATPRKDTLLCVPDILLCLNYDSCADQDHIYVVQFIGYIHTYICGNLCSPRTMDGRASDSIWVTNCYIIYDTLMTWRLLFCIPPPRSLSARLFSLHTSPRPHLQK